jgi:hypothetical protein
MPRVLILAITLLFCFGMHSIRAQEAPAEGDSASDIVLLQKQWTLGLLIHTNGWGAKFRKGTNITYFKQRLWELEYSTYKSPKEIRTINPYFADARSYFYGKLNTVSFIRGGIGFQHILNTKPYWGGVQLSAHYYGGLSIGVAKPVYLYIIQILSAYDYVIVEEKYNPDIHTIENIYGRGSFLAGLTQISLHPGVYVKGGLEFEYGTKNRRINSIETGITLDYSPIPIAIMAYNPKQSFFLTLYLSFSLGKRYNKGD